jgi:hypothetical protein
VDQIRGQEFLNFNLTPVSLEFGELHISSNFSKLGHIDGTAILGES